MSADTHLLFGCAARLTGALEEKTVPGLQQRGVGVNVELQHPFRTQMSTKLSTNFDTKSSKDIR